MTILTLVNTTSSAIGYFISQSGNAITNGQIDANSQTEFKYTNPDQLNVLFSAGSITTVAFLVDVKCDITLKYHSDNSVTSNKGCRSVLYISDTLASLPPGTILIRYAFTCAKCQYVVGLPSRETVYVKLKPGQDYDITILATVFDTVNASVVPRVKVTGYY